MVGFSAAPILIAAGLTLGQADFGFTSVKPQVFDAEKKAVSDLWVLGFEFRKPRFIMANIPGEGRKLVWYMVYKIVNRTDEPRNFIPRFRLITNPGAQAGAKIVGDDPPYTKGLESKTFDDVILPQALEHVRLREDPTHRTFYDSVTITKPIPPTPKDGAPIERWGVVFWKDVPMGDTKRFNIDITGLSNGYRRIEDPKDKKKEIVYRKTLELRFSKAGDDYNPDYREIRLDGIEWVYK
jgi:hypothetical protein